MNIVFLVLKKGSEIDIVDVHSVDIYLKGTQLLSQEGLKTSKDDQRTHHSNNAENTYKMMYQTFGIQIFEKIKKIQAKKTETNSPDNRQKLIPQTTDRNYL